MAKVGAFFDVDRTLVACNTGRLFLRDLRRRGEISFLRALRAMGWMLKYHFSLIELDQVAAMLALQMRGKSEKDFAERCRRWVEDDARIELTKICTDGSQAIAAAASLRPDVIVLDIDGNQLAAFDVNVTSTGDRNISVFKAGRAFSSVCAPLCQFTLETGEDQEWFKVLNEQHTGKAGQSAGALKLGD